MKTAVIYARYSSERQTEQSIEGQLRVCNDYAIRNEIAIIDTYIDRAMTGTNDKRTAFQKMLKDSNKKAWDYVIVYKIDRFGRNKYELAMNKHTLKLNGIRLISAMENIPDTPEGIILESLLEGMAEYYSAELSQKVRRGMVESREKGNFTGGIILYGYKVENKKVLINEDEAQIVRKLFLDFASGKLVTDILDELRETGILYRGKPFGRNTLYNFLRNEKYIGKYTHNGEVFTNIYPAIITEELFETVKTKIDNNKYGKHKPHIVYLLKFKMNCGYCGHSVNSDSGTSKTGKIMRYYKCSGKRLNNGCDLKPIRKELIEELVVSIILKSLENSSLLQSMAEKITITHNQKLNDSSVLNLLYAEKEQINRSIENILSAMDKGIVTDSTKEHLQDLEFKKKEIAEKIALENAKELLKITVEDVMKHLKNAISKKPRQMIDLLVKEVKLFNDKIEIYFKYNRMLAEEENKEIISVYKDSTTIETFNNNVANKTKVDIEILV